MPQKKILDILSSTNRTPSQQQLLVETLSNLFFKTIYTPFNIEQLLPHMRLKGYSPHELIYKEGDKIADYYLLLEGPVVFRRGGAGEGSPGQNSEYGPCVIGEYYYSRNTVREKSAYCGDGPMKVLEISKRVMDENNWQQVREYKEIQSYIQRRIGDFSESKINLYSHFRIQHFQLNTYLPLAPMLYIIMKGQCQMSCEIKPSVTPATTYSVHHNHKKPLHKKMLLLSTGQWIRGGVDGYAYRVKSEKLMVLVLEWAVVKLIEGLEEKIVRLHNDRISRSGSFGAQLQMIGRINNYNNSISLQRRNNREAQKLLSVLDKSVSPAVMRQKYSLESSRFKRDLPDDENKVTRLDPLVLKHSNKGTQQLTPQKQKKDWSQYLKLPSIDRVGPKENMLIRSIKI